VLTPIAAAKSCSDCIAFLPNFAKATLLPNPLKFQKRHEMSGHGFRAMARTILDEVLHVRPDYIEDQLAHAVRDPNGRAYNRTDHLVERRKMMQRWADYLDKLKGDAKVVPIRGSVV
jgi:integrase